LVLLAIAAALAATPPARGPSWDVAADRAPATGEIAAAADDLLLTVSVKPGRPGPNLITLGVFDTRRPAPAPIERVSVTLTAPGSTAGSPIEASPLGGGRYSAASDLVSAPGEWAVAITIDRPGLPVATLTTPWSIVPPPAPADVRPELVSKRPLEPILTWAAALAAVAFVGLLALAVLLRRRSTIIAGVGAPGADVRSVKARFATVRGGPR
jgi:copper transport protein